MWSGGFPLYHATASGARLTDIDGHEFIDFCLGGATTMLPTQDAAWVAAELTRRFKVARWSFTLTATDANR